MLVRSCDCHVTVLGPPGEGGCAVGEGGGGGERAGEEGGGEGERVPETRGGGGRAG